MQVVLPEKKQFMVVGKTGEQGAATGGSMGRGPQAPCRSSANLSCIKSAGETIHGIKTERWTVQPKGAQKPMVIYWDPTRKLSLRQVLPNGNIIEMRPTGDIQYENRKVEKWAFTLKNAQGERPGGEMYYDPELHMAVLERRTNGFSRALTNIKVGPLDAALFQVPAGFQKSDLPRGSGAH